MRIFIYFSCFCFIHLTLFCFSYSLLSFFFLLSAHPNHTHIIEYDYFNKETELEERRKIVIVPRAFTSGQAKRVRCLLRDLQRKVSCFCANDIHIHTCTHTYLLSFFNSISLNTFFLFVFQHRFHGDKKRVVRVQHVGARIKYNFGKSIREIPEMLDNVNAEVHVSEKQVFNFLIFFLII